MRMTYHRFNIASLLMTELGELNNLQIKVSFWPHKAGLDVCTYIRPFPKNFLRFKWNLVCR